MIDYLRTCCEFTSVHLLGLFLCIAFVVHTYAQRLPKKKFDKKKPTTVLITGGAQGLGKLLAQQFASHCPPGSVKLIIWDIRDDLEESCIADVKKAADSHRFSSVVFYKANLANAQEVELLWSRVTSEHGPIHILVNNAARCLGKRVDELTLSQVKLTMDINFHSYVQLMMLF